jgi:hypothetical protein
MVVLESTITNTTWWVHGEDMLWSEVVLLLFFTVNECFEFFGTKNSKIQKKVVAFWSVNCRVGFLEF